jgi:hypothetical protein
MIDEKNKDTQNTTSAGNFGGSDKQVMRRQPAEVPIKRRMLQAPILYRSIQRRKRQKA